MVPGTSPATPSPVTAGSVTPASTVIHRSESSSDISVLSNPSQSSIEVLPRRASPQKDFSPEKDEGDEVEEKLDGTMVTTTDTLKADEAAAAAAQLAKKMMESSSSGSMADSVITTHEVPAAARPPPPAPPMDEEKEQPESGVEVAEDVLSSMDGSEVPATSSSSTVKGGYKSESNGNISTDDTESYRTAISDLSLNLITANTTVASNTPGGTTDGGDSTPSGDVEEDLDASTPKAKQQQQQQQSSLTPGRLSLPSGLRQMAGPMSLFSALKSQSQSAFSSPGVAEGEKLPEDADDGLALAPSAMEWDHSDFSNADHRLKLYCELTLCDEPGEIVLLTARAWLVLRSTARGFLAVLVVSNKRIHVLRVTKAET